MERREFYPDSGHQMSIKEVFALIKSGAFDVRGWKTGFDFERFNNLTELERQALSTARQVIVASEESGGKEDGKRSIYRDAARRLGVPEATVRSRLDKASDKLGVGSLVEAVILDFAKEVRTKTND